MAAYAHDLIEEQRAARRAPKPSSQAEARVMLTEWQSMSGAERQALLAVRNAKAKLTRQDKESSIEWARWSWNPSPAADTTAPTATPGHRRTLLPAEVRAVAGA